MMATTDATLEPWTVSSADFPEDGEAAAKLTFLVGYAVLAPSGHNTQPVVKVEFDNAGDIVAASSQMRPRESDGAWKPTPWGGAFRDYQTLNGIRVPTWAEVYWELPEARFVYWRGTVDSAVALDQPFRRSGR